MALLRCQNGEKCCGARVVQKGWGEISGIAANLWEKFKIPRTKPIANGSFNSSISKMDNISMSCVCVSILSVPMRINHYTYCEIYNIIILAGFAANQAKGFRVRRITGMCAVCSAYQFTCIHAHSLADLQNQPYMFKNL